VLASNQRGGRHSLAGLLLAVAGAFAFFFAVGACDGRSTRIPNQNADLTIVEIPVEGMTCAACAARVKRALTSMEGVSAAEVSLADRRARVRFDPKEISPEQLVSAIASAGYTAGAATEARP
jgi:copper chaperone CopZ